MKCIPYVFNFQDFKIVVFELKTIEFITSVKKLGEFVSLQTYMFILLPEHDS